MSDNFNQIKKTWLSVDERLFPDFETFQKEMAHLRKQKRNRILLWYSGVIFFSMLIIWYVIYTDELNSIYKSISEFILLFTSIYLFRNAWKSINQHRKEYLLSNVDFIKTIREGQLKSARKQILISSVCTSLFMLSLFFYFLNGILSSKKDFLILLSIFITGNIIVWLLLKPIFEKKIMAKNKQLLTKMEVLFNNLK